jgi:single-stranded-DNA-specific exonuclease
MPRRKRNTVPPASSLAIAPRTAAAAVSAAVAVDATFVTRSVSGRAWTVAEVDERHAFALAQRLGLPVAAARALAARGLDGAAAESFLAPTLRASLPDPSSLADMDAAADRLARAIERDEAIAIFADYDVDGATAAAVLGRFLRMIGRRFRLYVPDRLVEGYGPTPDAMRRLADEGARVVVTVDCGTTAHAALDAAAAAGMEVIVVDHHAPDAELPRAAALINPKRADDRSGQGHLAAVGVSFLLVVAVNRLLRARGFYAAGGEPDLRALLDVVALGTICDCVPLIGVNRALVVQGLKVMGGWQNAGLKALADLAGLAGAPAADDAAFGLGPRINAGGRVGEAGLGARLLVTEDAATAAEFAERLERANRARRKIEAAVHDQAVVLAEAAGAAPLVFVAGDGWHPGVVGIVASRLVERFRRPACVVALGDGNGNGTGGGTGGVGSGRSVAGFDLGAAVLAAREAGLVTRGGGHAMAAGFAVDRARLDALAAFLGERLTAARDRPAPALNLDGVVRTSGDAAALADGVQRLGPFGNGNPEPVFALAHVRVAQASSLRGEHVRVSLEDGSGRRLDGMAFRAGSTEIGQALMRSDGVPLHVAGRVRRNGRGGNRPQLLIDDVARP